MQTPGVQPPGPKESEAGEPVELAVSFVAVLPSQFFATAPRQAPNGQPERRLLVALLEDALRCYQRHLHGQSLRERRLFEDAEEWIMGPVESAEGRAAGGSGFSFEYVCQVLGVDAAHARRSLQRWRDARL